MRIRKMVIVPIAGMMLSGALVLAQDNPQQPPQADQPQNDQTPAGTKESPAEQRQRNEQGTENRTAQGGDHAKWKNPEQVMAACVAIDNQEEVALVNAVKDKLQHEEVKKFASMLTQEHQDYLAKLEKFAPGVSQHTLDQPHSAGQAGQNSNQKTDGADDQQANRSPVERARATNSANAPGVRQTAGTKNDAAEESAHQGQMDVVQIQREIAQECLREAREEMSQKQGADADKCFIGFQIAKHSAMKSKLTVLQRHASEELAQVFAEGARTADQHKTQAIAIMTKLEGAGNKSSAANERRDDRREEREERQEQRNQRQQDK